MSWVLVQCLISFWTRVLRRRRNNNSRNQNVELEEEEKFFGHYLDLPPELRMMIVDEMEIKDRCRFTRCSKLCNKEAKSSKNYTYSLQICAHDEESIRIYMKYNEKQTNDDEIGYNVRILFGKERNKKFMAYLFPRNKELWRKKLSKSTNLVEYAVEYFKNLLKENRKSIKNMAIYGELFTTKLKNYDFGLESLNRLEVLDVGGCMNVPLYLSKLRRPLKKLYILEGQGDSDILAKCEKIYQVRDYVSAYRTKFTIEQLVRMSATFIDTDIGDTTEMNIFNFIQNWQNGTIGKGRRAYQWMSLSYSKFNIFELFKLLGKEAYYRSPRGSIEIEHNKEGGNIAELSYEDRFYVKFEVERRD